MGEGISGEAMNMASLWDVLLLVVIENIRYAQSTPVELNLAELILKRVKFFDLEADEVESNNVTTFKKFYDAINYTRKEQKSFVQIVNTYRLNAHSKGDDTRPKEEIQKWWKDPLIYIENKILDHDKNKIKDIVNKRIEETVTRQQNEF